MSDMTLGTFCWLAIALFLVLAVLATIGDWMEGRRQKRALEAYFDRREQERWARERRVRDEPRGRP